MLSAGEIWKIERFNHGTQVYEMPRREGGEEGGSEGERERGEGERSSKAPLNPSVNLFMFPNTGRQNMTRAPGEIESTEGIKNLKPLIMRMHWPLPSLRGKS